MGKKVLSAPVADKKEEAKAAAKKALEAARKRAAKAGEAFTAAVAEESVAHRDAQSGEQLARVRANIALNRLSACQQECDAAVAAVNEAEEALKAL